MNYFRAALLIGIVITCLLDWVTLNFEMVNLSISGLQWLPSELLLYLSIFSAGYAIYNGYRKSNQNIWLYLILGLYGCGVSIFIYLSIAGRLNLINSFLPVSETIEFSYKFGPGLYLTGLLSVILFITGFDKSDRKGQESTIERDSSLTEQNGNVESRIKEKTNNPNLKEWMKDNPGKSINDYYANLKGNQ
jgi:hypothetical protein